MTNEFEEMYNEDEFNIDDLEEVKTKPSEDLVADTSEDLEFDFSKAPKTVGTKLERKNLDGKTVIITDAKIILPKPDSPWELSKDKKTRYKSCQFKVYYDEEGQFEYYSGVRVFPVETPQGEKYSIPSIYNKSKTQAATLKKVYAKYKNKDVEKISMHEFLSFLKSKPNGKIKHTPFEYDDKVTHKNIVVEFTN